MILVVDDNDEFREAIQEFLAALGHEVHALRSGEAALAFEQVRGAQVDLLITDLDLSGVSGLAVIERFRRRRPDLPVIITSTGVSADGRGDLPAAEGVRCLPKPFSLRSLEKLVVEMYAPPVRRRATSGGKPLP